MAVFRSTRKSLTPAFQGIARNIQESGARRAKMELNQPSLESTIKGIAQRAFERSLSNQIDAFHADRNKTKFSKEDATSFIKENKVGPKGSMRIRSLINIPLTPQERDSFMESIQKSTRSETIREAEKKNLTEFLKTVPEEERAAAAVAPKTAAESRFREKKAEKPIKETPLEKSDRTFFEKFEFADDDTQKSLLPQARAKAKRNKDITIHEDESGRFVILREGQQPPTSEEGAGQQEGLPSKALSAIAQFNPLTAAAKGIASAITDRKGKESQPEKGKATAFQQAVALLKGKKKDQPISDEDAAELVRILGGGDKGKQRARQLLKQQGFEIPE